MGKDFPSFYFIEDALTIINDITIIDEKINQLAIEREARVADLKKKLKEKDNPKRKV